MLLSRASRNLNRRFLSAPPERQRSRNRNSPARTDRATQTIEGAARTNLENPIGNDAVVERTLEERMSRIQLDGCSENNNEGRGNWRDKLVTPSTVRQAIEVFPNERFLADSSIRTRNARWKLFVKWARDPALVNKYKV